MATLDWIILSGTLLFIVVFGVWRTRGSKNVDDYVLGGNKAKWWTIGLSVMATQASAITFLSTPGHGSYNRKVHNHRSGRCRDKPCNRW